MTTFIKPTSGLSRGQDAQGSGQFNAPRNGGKRLHNGLDIVSYPGEYVKSPIDGIVVREAFPYAGDHTLKGLVLRGEGENANLEIRIYYVSGIKSGKVKAGENIGIAQDITKKYEGITNHIHLEVRRDNQIVNPREFFNYCF